MTAHLFDCAIFRKLTEEEMKKVNLESVNSM